MPVPAAPLTASTEVTEVTARIDMSVDVAGRGLCPACRQPMTSGFRANGHNVMVCMRDRIAIPMVDDIGIPEV